MKQLLLLMAMVLTVQANADNYRDMEPLVLEVPDMKPELVELPERSALSLEMAAPTASPKMDFDFFKTKTNPDVKPYKFMDDMTFVGVPLFVAGWAVKGDKAMFRVNQKAEKGGKKNTQLLTDFKTGIDDYTQFFGPAMVVGLAPPVGKRRSVVRHYGRSRQRHQVHGKGDAPRRLHRQLMALGPYGHILRRCHVAPQGVWTHPLTLVVGGRLWCGHGNGCDACA